MTKEIPTLEQVRDFVIDALEDVKAIDIRVLDLTGKASFTDLMIIATGKTDRQVKSLANSVVTRAKKENYPPLGVEGEQQGEWVLVDLGDVVVHIMQPQIRDFYNMEKLWGADTPENAREL